MNIYYVSTLYLKYKKKGTLLLDGALWQINIIETAVLLLDGKSMCLIRDAYPP